MGNTKNRVYMTHIQITDIEKREEMITLKRKNMKNLRQFQRYLEVKKKDDKTLLHLVFLKQRCQQRSIKDLQALMEKKKTFEMKESNLKINRKINLELVTQTVLRSLKNLEKKEVRS